MLGAEFHTKEGNIYIANVIDKKIMKIGNDGKRTEWLLYSELEDGYVGSFLTIHRPEFRPMKTSEIIKIGFPKLEV